MLVSYVHPVAAINAAFCMTCSLLNAGRGCKRRPYGRVSKRHSLQSVDLSQRLQTAVHPEMGARFTVYGQAGHADPLGGWRCLSQKRVIWRLIQARQYQTNESGFVIFAINKYMLGRRYP